MTSLPKHVFAVVLALLLTSGACGDDDDSGGAAADRPVIDPGDGGSYDPSIDPADFVDVIDNPYLPLTPGARWEYEGISDGEKERDVVEVTDERKTIMGVSTIVVRDTVSVDGETVEDTYDWYAQDRDGNVWYFGEDVSNFEDGKLEDTDGSWEAGVDGALPGIVMPAHPKVGDAYRQEYDEGEAEDMSEVLRIDASDDVPFGSFDDVLVTRDWNPLEPDVIEEKHYAKGVGMISERAVEGADEESELVSFSPGT